VTIKIKGVLYAVKIAVAAKILTRWTFIPPFERSSEFEAINYPDLI
jgi:hypothetical protein